MGHMTTTDLSVVWLVGWSVVVGRDQVNYHRCAAICAKRGGVNWVDCGVTKQQSTNLAYVVVSEDNNNSNENKK